MLPPQATDTQRCFCCFCFSAAAYGGHEAVADLGNQIFVTMRKGSSWPPAACDVRIRYEQTIGDLKAAVATQLGVPAAQQQLFWHKQQLTAAYDEKTLLEMNMHTGFALKGYDLVRLLSVLGRSCAVAAAAERCQGCSGLCRGGKLCMLLSMPTCCVFAAWYVSWCRFSAV